MPLLFKISESAPEYYVNMSAKYSVGAGKMFSVSFLAVFEFVLGCFFADPERFSNFVSNKCLLISKEQILFL